MQFRMSEKGKKCNFVCAKKGKRAIWQFRFNVAVKAELSASEERAKEQLAKKEAELKRLELGAEVRKTKHHETMRLLGDKKKVSTDNRSWVLDYFCETVCLPISEINHFFSVSDPGCLSRFFHPVFRIRIFSIPDTGSTSKNLSILTQNIPSKLSEIWSGLFIPDPDPDSVSIPDPGSRGSKRHRIPDPRSCSATQNFLD